MLAGTGGLLLRPEKQRQYSAHTLTVQIGKAKASSLADVAAGASLLLVA